MGCLHSLQWLVVLQSKRRCTISHDDRRGALEARRRPARRVVSSKRSRSGPRGATMHDGLHFLDPRRPKCTRNHTSGTPRPGSRSAPCFTCSVLYVLPLLLRALRAPVPSSLRETRSSRPISMRHMTVALQFAQSPRLRASPWATTVAPVTISSITADNSS